MWHGAYTSDARTVVSRNIWEWMQGFSLRVKAKEITYDLLWALFKANTLVYTTCRETKKLRCIKYVSAAEETTPSGVEYFYIKGSYLDFDEKILGKVLIETAILKFIRSKPVNSLEAFPFFFTRKRRFSKRSLSDVAGGSAP